MNEHIPANGTFAFCYQLPLLVTYFLIQAQANKAIEELKQDVSDNMKLREEAAFHAQDAKKHMQKLSERTAQVSPMPNQENACFTQ